MEFLRHFKASSACKWHKSASYSPNLLPQFQSLNLTGDIFSDGPTLPAVTSVAPLLDLGCRLAVDEGPAAAGAERVVGGGAVDAVPLSGLPPQQEDGDAGEEAAREAAGEAAPAQVVAVAQDEQTGAEAAAQARVAVVAAAADALLPRLRHLGGLVGGSISMSTLSVEEALALLCKRTHFAQKGRTSHLIPDTANEG